jgi:hypothetical protein
MARWSLKKKEYMREYLRMYRKKYPEKGKEYRKRWQAKDPERTRQLARATGRRSDSRHREKRREKCRLYWRKNRARLVEKQRLQRFAKTAEGEMLRQIAELLGVVAEGGSGGSVSAR